ncbi:hypothetical protein D3C85_1609580 [compost metagenome]
MLVIDDVWMFMIGAAVLVQMSMVVGQVRMGMLNRFLVISGTPNHDADRQCATGYHSEPDKRCGEADIGTQPSGQWIGNQPAGMGQSKLGGK